jgi:hypothetical protein
MSILGGGADERNSTYQPVELLWKLYPAQRLMQVFKSLVGVLMTLAPVVTRTVLQNLRNE